MLYNYRCARCGYEEDREFPMGKAPSYYETTHNCPDLTVHKMKRIWGIAGIVFKGSGFYSTDKRGSYVDRDAAGKKETD